MTGITLSEWPAREAWPLCMKISTRRRKNISKSQSAHTDCNIIKPGHVNERHDHFSGRRGCLVEGVASEVGGMASVVGEAITSVVGSLDSEMEGAASLLEVCYVFCFFQC